ncbi:MAG: inositol monophosphatase [Gemmatimonadota bacterium]|nr:inositol monophosphatase [Gemmatimonadota bacterium]
MQASDHFSGARAAADLDAMVAAARTASRFIAGHAGDLSSLTWTNKATADFVSEVDLGAEAIIRDELCLRFPGAALLGEELSPDAVTGRGTAFIVDPLDGTTNFLHGYPEYAVSIAALVDGHLRAGVVLNAASGELFTARAGGGAFRNGQPIRVSSIEDPSRSLIGTGFPFKTLELLADYLPQLSAVTRLSAGVRRAGSAALDLCDVACGRFEAFWELSLAPWDYAAGTLIIREAGGIVTDLRARAPAWSSTTAIVAGSPVMHRWLLELITTAAETSRR